MLSFSRRFMANYYGGEAQYRYGSGGFSLIVRASATVRRDRVEGTESGESGRLRRNDMERAIKGLLERPQGLHAFEFGTMSRSRPGQRVLTRIGHRTKSQRFIYELLENDFSAVKYRTSRDEAGARWRYYRLDGSNGYRWHVGAELRYGDFENRYVLPASSLAARRVPAPNYRPVCRSFARAHRSEQV